LSTSLAVGSFDGIHVGHGEVIRRALDGPGKTVVVCFEPIPRQFFGSRSWRRRLTTPGERRSILGNLGVDRTVVFPFDQTTRSSGPMEFLTELEVIGRFERLVVGYDFHFGSDRSGSAGVLEDWTGSIGAELTVVPPVERSGEPVKSERIRRLLEKGLLEEVRPLLGRNYSVTGPVGRGKGFGRSLGFPTVNLVSPWCKMLPPAGSYVARIRFGEESRPAAAFVPSGNHCCLVEAFVPEWEGDLYGELAEMEFVSFMRPPRRGAGNEELTKLIKNDVEHVMEVSEEWQ
jgi:riboflavin kinase/FMN adenylyltransferase